MEPPVIIGGVIMSRNSYTFLSSNEKHGFESVGMLRKLLSAENRLPGKWNAFGRFSSDAQYLCLGCALALEDGGIKGEIVLRNTGIISSDNFDHEQDQYDYFKDYVDAGSQIGRSSLFVHTLPTSSAADAAVCLGLGGPLLYWHDEENPIESLVLTATGFITDGSAGNMLVTYRQGEKLLCLLLGFKEKVKGIDITLWSDIL